MSVTGATRQCVTCHCQHVGAQINPLQYNQKVKRSTYHVNSTVAHVSRAHAPASNMCTLHQYMSRCIICECHIDVLLCYRALSSE
eukprot:2227-Heterococcus_DN1.PRE.1